MKKTVIKRRKRVPAITSAAGRSNAPMAGSASPAPAGSQLPMTSAVPLARDGYGGGHDLARSLSSQPPGSHVPSPARLPSLTPGPPPLTSSYHDVLGLRGNAVPLQFGGGIGGERKRPWWVEDGREEAERRMREAAEREKRDRESRDKDQEGVSLILTRRFAPHDL
jgi:GATA-binding protein